MVLSEMNGLTRLRAPMAEDIFLLISSIWQVHERCSSITKPSDLASLTFSIDLPSISILIWLFEGACIR